MAYKQADKLNKKLKLMEEQKCGAVKQTNQVSTVITGAKRFSGNKTERKGIREAIVKQGELEAEQAKGRMIAVNTVKDGVGKQIKAGAQASAQVEIARGTQAQEQVKSLNRMSRNVTQGLGASEQSYGEAMKTQAERQWEAQILAGRLSGVTGSDQTGASIYGYREDISYKNPNNEWTDGERRLYEYYLKNNPEDGEAYAIRVNNRLNLKKKNEKLQNVTDWTSRNAVHGAAAWIGARGLNLGAGIDGINQQLEFAARDLVAVNSDLSMTDIVETVDNANAKNLGERYGKVAGIAYQIGTDISDAMLSRKINSAPVASLPNKERITVHDVNEALDAFNRGYLGVQNNKITDAVGVGLDAVLGHMSKEIAGKLIKSDSSAKNVMEEVVAAAVDNIAEAGSVKWFEKNRFEIEKRKTQYMKEQNITEQKAWWMATKELIAQSMK